MKEKIYDARTGMEYVLVGDYYLPALKLPRTRPIGRWGMLHKAYLKLRKPAYYQSLLLSGKLDTVDRAAESAGERIGKAERRKSDGVGTPYEKSGKSCSRNRKGRIDLHV